ncbi:hypothetical protein BKA64DRAFT_708949 [Cadophora sp. MPI-SDFR-AT-0126]|nr:hypothetical protein BKA64DRAFT_708949 [Leotiomycetes sp. MPI-SDFR-AT-0126]
MSGDYPAMTGIMDPIEAMKQANDKFQLPNQEGPKETLTYEQGSSSAMTQTPLLTRPSTSSGPSAGYFPIPANSTTPMDLSTLSKLRTPSHAIGGTEKGSTPCMPPLPAEYKPPSPLSRPRHFPRRLSVPAGARFDIPETPTTPEEYNIMLNSFSANLTGDNMFRFAHLVEILNTQDVEIQRLMKIHQDWDLAAVEIASKYEILQKEHEKEKVFNKILQNAVSETVDPSRPEQVRYINGIAEENANLRAEIEELRRHNLRLTGENTVFRIDNTEMHRRIQSHEEEMAKLIENHRLAQARVGRKNQSARAKAENRKNAQLEKLGEQISDLNENIKSLESQIKDKDQEITDLKTENSSLETQLGVATEAATDLKADLTRNAVETGNAEEMKKEHEKKVKELQTLLNTQENQIFFIQGQLTASQTLQEALNTAIATVASLELALAKAQTAVHNSEQYRKLSTKYSSIKTDLSDLTIKHKNVVEKSTADCKRFEVLKKQLQMDNANLKNQVNTLNKNKSKEKNLKCGCGEEKGEKKE